MGAQPSWTVLTSRAVEATERDARRAGYRAYVPRYRKLVYPHGTDRKPASILVPLFGGLIFVQDWRGFPQHIQLAGECRVMLVYRGGEAAKLSDRDVELIKQKENQCAYDDIVYPIGPGMGAIVRKDKDVGETFEIAYLGKRVMGALEGLSDNGKAFLRTAFGRIEVDAEALMAVAS